MHVNKSIWCKLHPRYYDYKQQYQKRRKKKKKKKEIAISVLLPDTKGLLGWIHGGGSVEPPK